jgi:phosphoglycolate phosphatase-like HAD superfamily hydrolase
VDFEIVSRSRPPSRTEFAIFDHDGTVSVLREGWEKIMEPVMVRAILGEKYATADESLYHRVVARVRDYIDKSTGIQTLLQMQGLVGMVREFGCVPAAAILDELGYKRIYNDALMELVRVRLGKLRRGELSVDDLTLKDAVPLLRRLKASKVRMYLASGTDEADVISEARELGYADLFDGGIHGSVGDVNREAKKIVLDRIISDIGAGARLITFGDGPVEMRETHKRGGFAVGVASDEVRRFGMNWDKRTRLIRAGADLVIPDFSQLDRLLETLGLA